MQNCYAVVIERKHGEAVVLDVFTTYGEAVRYAADVCEYNLIARPKDVTIVEVTLTAVYEQSRDPLVRLEHDLRTIQTLLTALNGRVAELSGAQGTK